MSDLQLRTKEILERGVAERDNWTPGGFPLRIYQSWAKHSRNVPKRENFCHYWRVVAIWAPLMAIRLFGTKMINNGVIAATMAVVALALLVFSIIVSGYAAVGLIALVGGFGAMYLLAGVILGLVFAFGQDAPEAYNGETNEFWYKLGFLSTLPASLPVWGVSRAALSWPKRWNRPLGNALGYLVVAACAIGVVTMVVVFFIETGWAGLLMMLGIVAGLGAAAILFAQLSDFISGKRSIAADKRLEARFAELDEPSEPTTRIPKGPSAIQKFFTNLADVVVFIAQVVRVKKWGICPLVTIPKDSLIPKDEHEYV